VRLRGDWIAGRGDLRVLEDALAGLSPSDPDVRAHCARWLADPRVLAIGVVAPDAIAEAIRRSAAAAD
jgi:hypothetical protein